MIFPTAAACLRELIAMGDTPEVVHPEITVPLAESMDPGTGKWVFWNPDDCDDDLLEEFVSLPNAQRGWPGDPPGNGYGSAEIGLIRGRQALLLQIAGDPLSPAYPHIIYQLD